MPDVVIEDFGTVWTITQLTDFGRGWVDIYVHSEPWQWLQQDVLVVEHCMILEIVCGMRRSGLRVEIRA